MKFSGRNNTQVQFAVHLVSLDAMTLPIRIMGRSHNAGIPFAALERLQPRVGEEE